MSTADERRDFYRINDTVGLAYEACPFSQLPSPEEFAKQVPDAFQLVNHLSRIDLDNSALLHSIQDSYPDIARYLKLQNQKIESIAKQVVTIGLTDEVQPTEVTLSAGGLSLITDQSYNMDSHFHVRMILYPSNAVIDSYAKVVRSQATDDGFDTALEYSLIQENDRDTLVRHVLQLQSNTLRNRQQ